MNEIIVWPNLTGTMLKPLVHKTAVKLIQTYKWSELKVFRSFHKFLERKGTELAEKIGVVFHFTEDGDIYDSAKWTSEKEAEALKKCQRYNSIVHIQINDKKEYFTRLANTGSLGAGEIYMHGIMDFCESEEDITEFCTRFMENDYLTMYLHPWNRFLNYLEL